MPMHDPPHPGLSVRVDCLDPNGLAVIDAAKALGASRKALSSTPEMWLGMQMAYDLAQARRREPEITAGVRRLEPA